MKKIDFGQTITILTNLSVIAGIVFLGFEMRQNTVAVNSTAAQAVHEQLISVQQPLHDDAGMDIYLRGMGDPSSLNRLERARFHTLLQNQLQTWESLYRQVRLGALDEKWAEGYWLLLRSSLNTPGFQEHFRVRGFVLSQEFRSFIESEIMPLDPAVDLLPSLLN